MQTARWDLLPPRALKRCAETMAEGAAKYGDNNWKGLPLHDPISHAVAHLYAYLSGDRKEDHLSHAACNCLIAAHLEEQNNDNECPF